MPKSVASGKLSVNTAVIQGIPVQAAMASEKEVMAGHYHHTQRGNLMPTTLSLAALVSGLPGILAITLRSGHGPLLFAPSALCCGLAWLFSSLTVKVSGTEIRWYFRPRLWDYRVALSDIEDVRIVRNTWLNGFGIRMRPGWRLYNVSGLDAVELHLKTGDIRCIGTDDPRGLAAALKSSGPA
ncbi:MAG: hypothetical protein ACREDD_01345 [Methylocella sp.]